MKVAKDLFHGCLYVKSQIMAAKYSKDLDLFQIPG
jgi:hypothetical protein